jgi:hypothetical protein
VGKPEVQYGDTISGDIAVRDDVVRMLDKLSYLQKSPQVRTRALPSAG